MPANFTMLRKASLLIFCQHFTFLLLLGLTTQSGAAPLPEGVEAPAVELPNLPRQEDKTTSLESLRGKVVYLDFFASWCGPCRISLPRLNEIRNELADRGFEVLAVNVDEFEEDALAFLEEIPVDYPVIWDPQGDSPRQYGILGMPTAYLVDREGVIRHVHQGFRKSDTEKVRAMVIELLGEHEAQ
jgi:thiol-disulfide isomerase/thioredoxin